MCSSDLGPAGIGQRIRTTGREYGTVTGRPRRVGWFDAVAARYAADLAGADEITVMLLDVLSGLPELQERGLVAGEPPRLTQAGSDTYDRVVAARRTALRELCAGWEPDENPEIDGIIGRLANALAES